MEEDDLKKPQLSASLGLSLLQAYDEGEPSSEDEDESELPIANSAGTKDASGSAFLSTEEENEISSVASDVPNHEVELTAPDQPSLPREEACSEDPENGKVGLDNSNEFDSKLRTEESETERHEHIPDLDYGSVSSVNSGDVLIQETVHEEVEKKPSETMRLDANLPVTGDDVNSPEQSGNDSKPIKKVKLNRSKFVRPADESSNETKTSQPTSTTTGTDQISTINSVLQVELVQPESDTSINDLLDPVFTRVDNIGNENESMDEIAQEVDKNQELIVETIRHTQDDVLTSPDEVNSVQPDEDDYHSSNFIKRDDNVNFISVPDENIDELTIDSEENLPNSILVSETVLSLNNEEPSFIAEIVTDDQSLEGDDSMNIAKEDTLLHPERTKNEHGDRNEDADIASPEVDDMQVEESITLEKDNIEADIIVCEDNSSEIIDELEGDSPETEIVTMRENVDEDPAGTSITCENESETPPAIKVPDQFTSKLGHMTSDEETFEDAVEMIETTQNQVVQETSENITASEHVQVSKLEQALTGQLENSQLHLKTPDSLLPIRKDSSLKVKPASEDAKQNIKLHISVQGDRVSIKNTQSATEASPVPAVRVKRQYRKRTRVPGELEAQQASAKEYTHRLRQRTERETPGAKKRTRKKKDQELTDSPESKTETGSNSSSADASEKIKPLTVAIDKLPSRKRNIAGKVQPIKLKISKNSDVTFECTSKYDVCSEEDEEEEEEDSETVANEKEGFNFEEASQMEEPSSNSVEEILTSCPESELQRLGRLYKDSGITITPVASEKDDPFSPAPVPGPISDSSEKFQMQPTPPANTEPALAAAKVGDEISKNFTISLKADVDGQNSPWKIVKSPLAETAPSSFLGALNSSKPVDVKSEIRKKIASLEKRKHDVSTSEIESLSESPPETEATPVDSPSPSELDLSLEDSETDKASQSTDANFRVNHSMSIEAFPGSASSVHKTPSTATSSSAKLPRLPADLFPKKRGRPTKAMVAAREAYWQQQEELEKSKRGDETDVSVDVCISTPTVEPPVKTAKRGRKMKSERFDKKDSDDLSYEELPYDPNREAEEQKRVEEERVKKEEERERKNELRRLRAKERSDVIKAKRLRQKMKAKERHKMAKEARRLQLEEKKKLEEQLKRLPASMGFDDDTRMSAENSQAANLSFSVGLIDDDSSGATNDLSQKFKKSRMEVTDPDSKDLMVNQIAEYQWPIQGGDLYMIQEQVSNFLGVKSFKRKYPDIWRRSVDSEERAYLVDSGLVSETLCDLGITAVRSAEVLDIMCSDFPEKYEEFRRSMREKQMKELTFKQRAWANGLGYKLLMADGSKQDLKKRAMESVSNWNSALNKSRVEDRRSHMDLQTFVIHYPKQRGVKMTLPSQKVGSYPVPILPGQFCDFYKEYTPTELRYLPVNTVLYGPLRNPTLAQNDYASQTDSDDSSSSDDSSTTSEDTQATEETVEDLESSTVLDGSNMKLETSFTCDDDQILRDANGERDPLSENDPSRALCKVCLGDEFRNKTNVPEVLLSCSQCASTNHPTCLDLSLSMVPRIKSYSWQCPDCKICAQCKENADEDKMLFCDTCDRGYHIYCVGLIKVPAGNWQCKECSKLKENNAGSVVDVVPKKEYATIKKEEDLHLIEMTG